MNINTLDWDSRFFGLRIGRVELQTPADATALQKQHTELKQQYDLLYVFDTVKVGFAAAGAPLSAQWSISTTKVLLLSHIRKKQTKLARNLYPNGSE